MLSCRSEHLHNLCNPAVNYRSGLAGQRFGDAAVQLVWPSLMTVEGLMEEERTDKTLVLAAPAAEAACTVEYPSSAAGLAERTTEKCSASTAPVLHSVVYFPHDLLGHDRVGSYLYRDRCLDSLEMQCR